MIKYDKGALKRTEYVEIMRVLLAFHKFEAEYLDSALHYGEWTTERLLEALRKNLEGTK